MNGAEHAHGRLLAGDGPVLVTGAGGCIGAWVIARLSERGIPAVALDLRDDRRRLRLLLDEEAASGVTWATADVAVPEELARVIERHAIRAVIHLAALQVPFCRADPWAGARVNVLGNVAVMENARRLAIRRVVYASSVAATGPDHRPATLYGVYKAADEGLARVYWQDWEVPSIGLRPHTVYGLGRDQGLTSAPTQAMLAAAAGRPYTIPFRGPLQMQHAGEVADIFIAAAAAQPGGADVLDLRGSATTVEEVADLIRRVVPDAALEVQGPPLPFPADFDDEALARRIGPWSRVDLGTGIEETMTAFGSLLRKGLIDIRSIPEAEGMSSR